MELASLGARVARIRVRGFQSAVCSSDAPAAPSSGAGDSYTSGITRVSTRQQLSASCARMRPSPGFF